MALIGRDFEQNILNQCLESGRSEFIAVFGRRRIGKTFLIREFFDNKFFFYLTGSYKTSKSLQLQNFNTAMRRFSKMGYPVVNDWFAAFEQLHDFIEASKSKAKKVIFLDEVSWLDAQKSGFIQALEYFWNSYASARKDVVLIVCASATSWLIKNILKNKGGLHNRVTQQLALQPFTLQETELFLKSRGMDFSRKQIVEYYMVLGGVPFYLELLKKGNSVAQNIDALLFANNARLGDEFSQLYASLFQNYEKHISIVEALSSRQTGLTRKELLSIVPFADGGSVTRILRELEQCGFIKTYNAFGKKSKDALFQVVDFYSLFYFSFIKDKPKDKNSHWLKMIDNAKHRAWSGYGFEQVCLAHEEQIRKKLGIAGVISYTCSWRSKNKEDGAQIDLLIDRNDHVINICEMKFSNEQYCLDKDTHKSLIHRKSAFANETRTRKAVHLTMVTTYGLVHNEYWNDIQSEVTMDDLFEPAAH